MSEFPKVHHFSGRFMVLPRDHVRAYVVELENSVVVVDSTLALDSATELRQLAESFGKPINAVLVTHGHPDHYTGLARFADVPRYASQGCLEFAHREDVTKAPVAKGYLGDDYPDVRVFPDKIVKDGDTLTFDGVTFTFSDYGPGESDSDGIWTFQKDRVLHAFVGDLIANNCHCFFRDGHADLWLEILDRMEKEFPADTAIYVGHGDTPVGKERIDWQRGYVKTFLKAVDAVEDRSLPVSRETQEKVIAAMMEYLDSEATYFLLDYELDVTLPIYWNKRAPVAT
jgi:glyoxylase-like metal-dependent hydrolase (beta-lactamase superfamily II)